MVNNLLVRRSGDAQNASNRANEYVYVRCIESCSHAIFNDAVTKLGYELCKRIPSSIALHVYGLAWQLRQITFGQDVFQHRVSPRVTLVTSEISQRECMYAHVQEEWIVSLAKTGAIETGPVSKKKSGHILTG